MVKRKSKNIFLVSFALFLSLLVQLCIPSSQSFAAANCTYPNFDGCDLHGLVFEKVDLTGASFIGANLSGASFRNSAILENAKFDGVDLRETELREIFAPGASFVGANLSGVYLLNASLNRANFSGAELNETYFVGSNLYLADFGTAKIDNTIFEAGELGNAKFGQAQIKSIYSQGRVSGVPSSLPAGWLFRAGCFIGPNATTGQNCDFSDQDLSGVRSGPVEMAWGWALRLPKRWTLAGDRLNNRGMVDGYLIGPGADLQQEDLSGFDLTQVSSGPYLGNPTMPRAWQFRNGYFIGPGVNLESADFSSKNMTGASLRGALLRKANLSSSDFRGASVVGATFREADLSNARFDDVWLQKSDLSNTKLENTNLSKARLDGMRACSIQGVPTLPKGYSVISGNIVGPNLNLAYCDLRNANLNGVDLSYADLSNANLAGADLSGANLTGVKAAGGLSGDKAPRALPPGWQIVNSVLVGPHADLTDRLLNANLGNLDLSSAVLQGAQIRDSSGLVNLPKTWRIINGVGVGPGANLSGAELNGADLSEIDLRGVRGRLSTKTKTLTLPVGWHLKQGYLIGPGADLTGAYLNGADLSLVDLRGIKGTLKEYANITLPAGWKVWKGTIFGKQADISNQRIDNADLTGVDLSGATLTGAQLLGITGKPILPIGYRVVDGVLVGPGVNLSDVTWIKSSLSKTSLEGATLSGFSIAPELTTGVPLFNALTTDRDISHSFGQGWSVQTDGTIVGSFSASPTPTLSGLAKVGETLRAVPGSWTAGVSFTYQWLRDGGEITGASEATYRLSAADLDKQISVVLTASKPGYLTLSKTSAVTRIEAASLVLSPTPTVSGVSQVGQTLTSAPGTWDSGVNLTYQWLRDGAPISGESKNSLKLTAEDNGKQISFEVTGAKPGYVTVKKTSTTVKIEAGTMAAATPKITGTAKVGLTLKVSASSWIKGSKVTYKWLANGVAIKSATGSSLKLTSAMKGKKITVVVTQTANGYKTLSKTSSGVTVK
jgi:uncharacterized protein YjbI with pentapeptide repeats